MGVLLGRILINKGIKILQTSVAMLQLANRCKVVSFCKQWVLLHHTRKHGTKHGTGYETNKRTKIKIEGHTQEHGTMR